MCFCRLRYPACKAHALYYVAICGLCDSYRIFLQYVLNGTILGEKLLNIKCVFWFSVQLLCETFLVVRIQWEIAINVRTSSCKVPVILVRFEANLSFVDGFFLKNSSHIKFNENPSKWAPHCFLRTDRQTDRDGEVNSRFSQCREFALKTSIYFRKCN